MAALTYEGKSLSITASEGTSPSIYWQNTDGGRFVVTAASATTLTWYESYDGSVFKPAYDSEGAAVTQTIAVDRSYPVPPTLNACAWIKAVGDNTATIRLIGKQMGLVEGQVG